VVREQKLIEKQVDIEDCIPYPGGYEGSKADWRRTSGMYSKVKVSLKVQGMVNPLWVFETPEGKYRVVKGSCRAIVCYDLVQQGYKEFRKVKVLVAPLGMERGIANKLFKSSKFVEDIPMIDPKTYEFVMENGGIKNFPKGF